VEILKGQHQLQHGWHHKLVFIESNGSMKQCCSCPWYGNNNNGGFNFDLTILWVEPLIQKPENRRHGSKKGVKVQHYHADNGIFCAHKWVLDCRAKGQGLTFAGVNAHHQNGRAEARIR
jgi:hypothetical protein